MVPEGLVEFIPEVNQLIKELNEMDLTATAQEGEEAMRAKILGDLSAPSAALFAFLPTIISNQLLLDRDPHGNILTAQILIKCII